MTEHQLKLDSLGNPIGFSATGGHYKQGYIGEIPIRLTPMFIADDSCATQITVKPVAADICKVSEVPADGDADLWIERTTQKFPNPVHGVGENALRLVYKRDLTNQPLPASCNGQGFTVTVTASDKDVDANLPIPGIWPGVAPTPTPTPAPTPAPTPKPGDDHGHQGNHKGENRGHRR